ncbi:tRNA (guanosine(46)-N7)-methyltransferase TrmB [Acetobacteraceae bacterium]|nr:tRNA (guanosine(46)-N7)-methyltransferase TrmB [Acetobacteraceae bacterium]
MNDKVIDLSSAKSGGELSELKAQPTRLYGRRLGHPLRQRQEELLTQELPRFSLEHPENPLRDFPETTASMPLWLEIGFGSGEHISKEMERGEKRYIASEFFENGICSLLGRLVEEEKEKGEMAPVRLWAKDARVLLDALPTASLDGACLFFPDPWPKKRHAKRRFVHPDNLKKLARVIKPGGKWRVATDHPVYQEWVREVMDHQNLFKVFEPATTRPAGWSPTRYEAKAFREGRDCLYWEFENKGLPIKAED